MKDQIFSKEIYYEVQKDILKEYQKRLESLDIKEENIKYSEEYSNYEKIHIMYIGLKDNEKQGLYSLINQVTTDVISNILGILDGSVTTENGDYYELVMEDTKEVISGDLQDYYLELVELDEE